MLASCFFTQAFAQQTTQANHFRFSDTLETVTIEDALGTNSELVQNKYLIETSYDFANDILTGTNTQNATSFPFIDHSQTIALGTGVLISNRIWVGIDAPIHYVSLTNAYVTNRFDPKTWRFGDLSLHSKIRITPDESKINLAFRPQINLPTGSDRYFTTDDSYGFGGQLTADTSYNQWNFFVNTGFSYASNSQFIDIDRRKTWDYGVGTFYKINQRIGINAEWLQKISLPHPSKGQTPSQANLGIRYSVGMAKVFIGGGIHRLKFSNNSHPFSFYAGIKLPFGDRQHRQPQQQSAAISTPPQEAVVDNELTNVIEYLSNNKIFFNNNHFTIKKEYQVALDNVAQLLQTHQNQMQYIVIHGYADPRGTPHYNQLLSEKRARAVKKYLISKGVHEEFILTDGFGSKKSSHVNKKDYALQRRAEFEVIKK